MVVAKSVFRPLGSIGTRMVLGLTWGSLGSAETFKAEALYL